MIVITGDSLTKADRRDSTVAAFAEMVARARKHDGCLEVAISADTIDPERINVFEFWRDQQALNAWRRGANAPTVELWEALSDRERPRSCSDAVLRPLTHHHSRHFRRCSGYPLGVVWFW